MGCVSSILPPSKLRRLLALARSLGGRLSFRTDSPMLPIQLVQLISSPPIVTDLCDTMEPCAHCTSTRIVSSQGGVPLRRLRITFRPRYRKNCSFHSWVCYLSFPFPLSLTPVCLCLQRLAHRCFDFWQRFILFLFWERLLGSQTKIKREGYF